MGTVDFYEVLGQEVNFRLRGYVNSGSTNAGLRIVRSPRLGLS